MLVIKMMTGTMHGMNNIKFVISKFTSKGRICKSTSTEGLSMETTVRHGNWQLSLKFQWPFHYFRCNVTVKVKGKIRPKPNHKGPQAE
jgi:hypothetical protein